MDRVEAKRNIERYETEITKWQALSRGLMSRDEMIIGSEDCLVKRAIKEFKKYAECVILLLHSWVFI